MLWIFLAKICAGALISTFHNSLYHYCIVSGGTWGSQKPPGHFGLPDLLGRPMAEEIESISPQLSSNQWCAHCCRHHIQLCPMTSIKWMEIFGQLPFWFMTQVNTWVFNREWYCKLSIAEALGKRWLYFLKVLYDFYTLLVIMECSLNMKRYKILL